MKKKVLIIDDEDNVRRLVAVTLAGGDYEVLQARDGVEALEIARRERPVLVLLDVMMPGPDGIEVCRRIKADPALRGATVVMLTAQAQTAVERRASAAGCDLYLTKPFSPIQIADLVRTVTAAR